MIIAVQEYASPGLFTYHSCNWHYKSSPHQPVAAMKRAQDEEEAPWSQHRKKAKLPQPVQVPLGRGKTLVSGKESGSIDLKQFFLF